MCGKSPCPEGSMLAHSWLLLIPAARIQKQGENMVENIQPSQQGLQLDSLEQEPPSPGAHEGHQLLPDHLQVSPMENLLPGAPATSCLSTCRGTMEAQAAVGFHCGFR